MYNDALNQLKTELLSAQMDDVSRLKALFDKRLNQALLDIHLSGYVEDCLFQITEALEELQDRPTERLKIRHYLLGAIEALRDELHLCDVETDVRKAVARV